jgi:hypothetical protein
MKQFKHTTKTYKHIMTLNEYEHPDRRQQRMERMQMELPRSQRKLRRERLPTTNSIVYTQWNEPTRPYSQKELSDLNKQLFKKLQLSTHYVEHSECGHYYYVKQAGAKYKQLMHSLEQENGRDIGNCSVCWKFRKSPKSMWDLCEQFLRYHNEVFRQPRHTYFAYKVYEIFYTWLYQEYYG